MLWRRMPAIRLYARAEGPYAVADEIYITAGKQLGIAIIVAIVVIVLVVIVLIVLIVIIFSLRKEFYAG